LRIDPQVLNAQTYWNHFQRLTPQLFEKIEVSLGKLIHSRYNLPLDHIFYDTSNFFTYGKPDSSTGLRRNGHSKQNQNGLPLVNFYLLCSKPYGIPLLHQTYAGSTQDAKTSKNVAAKILQHLAALGIPPSQFTLCFDKGNLSPTGFKEVNKAQLFFIGSLRNSMGKDLLHIPQDQFHTITLKESRKKVEYWKTRRVIYEQERTVYVLIDAAKQTKHRITFQEKLQKKTQAIDHFLQTQLNVKPQWQDLDQVTEKITALIGKAPWKQVITYNITKLKSQVAVTYQIDKTAQSAYEETLGRSILFTNRHDWSPEEVIWGYREQYEVEHAFRRMKDPKVIAIRPVYHSNAKCIEAHIFTCVLGYFLMAILRLILAQRGLHMTYNEIFSPLEQLHLIAEQDAEHQVIKYQLEDVPLKAVKIVKLLHLERLI